MSAVLKEILDDRNPWIFGQKAYVPQFKRFMYYKICNSLTNDKICVLFGVRQIGKTTLLLQLANDIFGSYNVFYVPIDSIVEFAEEKAIGTAVSVIEKYYFGKKLHLLKKPTLLVLDEVHFDNEWALQVKSFHDKLRQWGAPVKIIVTGSSMVSIKVAAAQYLTGRVNIEYMNPMSLPEIISLKNRLDNALIEAMEKSMKIFVERDPLSIVEEVLAILSPGRPYFEKVLREMLIYGGMPEVVAKNLRNTDAQRILESYVYITLFKDVLRILDYLGEKIKLAGKLEKIVRAILYKSPRIISINSIARDLGVTVDTVESYLELILATHLVQRADNYSVSPIVEMRKRKLKYFGCDTGIRNAVVWGIMPRKISPEEEGLLLENIALIHAKRILKRISWHKNPKFIKVKDKEGDIIIGHADKTILIETKRKERKIQRPEKYGIDKVLEVALYEEKNAIPAIIFLLADPIYLTLKKQREQNNI